MAEEFSDRVEVAPINFVPVKVLDNRLVTLNDLYFKFLGYEAVSANDSNAIGNGV